MQKKYIFFITIILLISITLATFAADLNELQEQKNQIATELKEKNDELNEVNEELTENLKQIQELDENINQAQKKLDELNNEIELKEIEIKKVQENLDKITIKYETQKQLLNERLITMYETDDVTYLNLLVDSKSIIDFVSSYFLLSEIAEYDVDLLETVAREKKEIELSKQELDEKHEQLENEKRLYQRTNISLSNTKILRASLIQNLAEEERKIQDQIDEYNAQINLIESEIKKLALNITFGEDYKGGTMQWPIYGHYTITSNYGMRVHPITGVYKLHTGVDISASLGTDFTAIADGIVVKAEYNGAYGNMVIIDHGRRNSNFICTWFSNNSKTWTRS